MTAGAIPTSVPVVVVGGGIAGLAAAERLRTRLGRGGVLLLDAEPRLGGKITTETVDGFVIEGGPDCFLGSKPAGTALCSALGLNERLIPTNPAFRKSFVKRNDRLHPLPDGLTGLVPSRLMPLLTTSVLSVPGRLRAALEILMPRGPEADESLASFVTRRFGTETWEWLAEPLVSGIFAGNGAELSLAATFPNLKDVERRYRSILWRMIRARFAAGSPAATGIPGFLTLKGGLGEMVTALGRTLGDSVRLSAPVARLEPASTGWRLSLATGGLIDAEQVVLAVPAYRAADMLDGIDATLARALRTIPFGSTATASVAFAPGSVSATLPGTGYVIPRATGGDAVACTWTSNKFPARAPKGGVLLRFFLGRAGRDTVVDQTDDEIKATIRAELRTIHGITAEPSVWRVFRWKRALPQYTLGHTERVAAIDALVSRQSGLFLAGASYKGVGIPDCIQSGRNAADAALAGLNRRASAA